MTTDWKLFLQCLLSEAREYVPEPQVGEEITIELPTDKFTRTASKNAKNAIVQKIREEQKNALYNDLRARKVLLSQVQFRELTKEEMFFLISARHRLT